MLTNALFRSHLAFSFLLLSAAPVFAQAPTNLTVKTATNKQIALSWTGTASSYNVQRAVLGAAFSTIATANTASYTDTTIDAYTTYQYQITATSGSTTPTNKVTVGPPSSGFSVAAAPPGIGQVNGNYGYDLSLALDGNGDPAMAWVFFDPNADTDPVDTQVLFRSWNRAQNAWNPIVKIVTTGGDTTSDIRPTVSLAYDKSTGTFGIACEDASSGELRAIDLFISPDGVTWTKKTAFTRLNSAQGPSLVLANGNIYIAFNGDNEGTFFVTGLLSAAPASWTTSRPKLTAPLSIPDASYAPSVAIDNSGIPAVAVWVVDSSQGYNSVLLFWRPVSGSVVKVTDTENRQTDTEVKLLFFGSNPRMIFHAQRNDGDFGVGMHYVQSTDAGNTWQKPVLIPPDGDSTTDYPSDFTLDSKGNIAVGFGQNGSSGDATCGNPKVSLSTDTVDFKTCDAVNHVGGVTDQFGAFPASLQIAYGGNDRLYLFWWESGGSSVGTGLLMYRQPPAGATTNPVINTDGTGVNNGGTNLPGGIVAGSWVAIKGANFADSPLDWSNSDFSNGLPTQLNGVQVLMNNAPAAVYYVSPGQINVQAPNSVASGGTISVQVVRNGAQSNVVTLNGSTDSPGIFAYTIDLKTFYPAAVFLDGTIIGDPAVAGSTVRKVKAGDRILLYVTGLNVSPAGVIISSPISVSPTPTVTIGTAQATVEFAGLVAPGEYQLNVVIPSGVTPGNQPIVVKMNGVASQSGVVIPVSN